MRGYIWPRPSLLFRRIRLMHLANGQNLQPVNLVRVNFYVNDLEASAFQPMFCSLQSSVLQGETDLKRQWH